MFQLHLHWKVISQEDQSNPRHRHTIFLAKFQVLRAFCNLLILELKKKSERSLTNYYMVLDNCILALNMLLVDMEYLLSKLSA